MKSHRMPPAECVNCQTRMDACTALTGDPNVKPQPGQLSVCGFCGCVMKWGQNLQLEAMDDDDWEALPQDLQDELKRISNKIKEVGGLRGGMLGSDEVL